jgi:hypothetical protein
VSFYEEAYTVLESDEQVTVCFVLFGVLGFTQSDIMLNVTTQDYMGMSYASTGNQKLTLWSGENVHSSRLGGWYCSFVYLICMLSVVTPF